MEVYCTGMEAVNVPIRKDRVDPDVRRIAALLGDQGESSADGTDALIRTCISQCMENFSPSGGYAVREALPADDPQWIAVPGFRFRTGGMIRKNLKGSEAYAFFVASAGPEPEFLSRRLMQEGEFLEGYITDLVASGIVESVADQVHDHIIRAAKAEGMKVTNRYSPGYCNWEVADQQKLFALFPQKFCGISLSDSSLMSPIKSISGIVGIGRQVGFNAHMCEICSMKECAFRESQISPGRYSPGRRNPGHLRGYR